MATARKSSSSSKPGAGARPPAKVPKREAARKRVTPGATAAPAAAGTPAAPAAPETAGDRRIRVGIGGWTFEPWRDNFYPAGLPHAQELRYASEHLSAIEVNGTYYSSFKPPTFRSWFEQTPEHFMFSLKASRYATNRRQLGSAGESITRFVDSGIEELAHKLGPIVWQLAPTKAFEPEDLEAFLALLPARAGSWPLRHVLDVRHPSFANADYLALARRYRVATVFTDAAKFPSFADLTGDFVYARLMEARPDLKAGYAPKALDGWAQVAQAWAAGERPASLPYVEAEEPASASHGSRDVFVFFINGAKEKAPHAAGALIERLVDDKR